MARNYRVSGRSSLGAAVAKIRAGVARTLISGEVYTMTDDEAAAARGCGLVLELDPAETDDNTLGLTAELSEVEDGI